MIAGAPAGATRAATPPPLPGRGAHRHGDGPAALPATVDRLRAGEPASAERGDVLVPTCFPAACAVDLRPPLPSTEETP